MPTLQLHHDIGYVGSEGFVRGEHHGKAVLGHLSEALRRVDSSLVQYAVHTIFEKLGDNVCGPL